VKAYFYIELRNVFLQCASFFVDCVAKRPFQCERLFVGCVKSLFFDCVIHKKSSPVSKVGIWLFEDT
jgi:hypothetical protein